MLNIFRGPRGSCQEEATLAAALLADCIGWFTILDSKLTALVSMGRGCNTCVSAADCFKREGHFKPAGFEVSAIKRAHCLAVFLSAKESSHIWAAVCDNLSHRRMLIRSLMSPLFAWMGERWGQTGQNSRFGTCVCSVDNATGFYPASHDCFTSFEPIISLSVHVHTSMDGLNREHIMVLTFLNTGLRCCEH